MELPDDVQAWLATTFAPADQAQAAALLVSARTEDGGQPTARLLRCAAFASGGQIARLRHWVAQMALDWRDVLTAGEYVARQDGSTVQARDFHQPLPDAAKALDDRLVELAEAGALDDDWPAVRRVALAWVSALALTGAEQRWLAQGAAFAEGRIGEAALEATRVEAWNSIDGRDCDWTDPEVSRVRAVLCVLYPDEDMQDAQMFLETLLNFYTGAQGDPALALRALNGLP